MYTGQQLAGLPLVPFDLFEFLSRSLPGGIVSLGIEWLIQFASFIGLGQTSSVGKAVEIAAAYLLTLVILSGFGGVYAISLHRLKITWVMRGGLAGLFLTIFAVLLANWGGWGETSLVISLSWLLITGLTWGIGLA
jgi:hypothetical protein